MQEADSGQPSTQRRRSERISKSVPIIVRGIDLLGQPFEERTSTLALNLHGCRYSSKHHLPKNTWVTLELAQGQERRNVRARVAWIQRPHSVREFFQIAVELESPANIWAVDSPPDDWSTTVAPGASPILFSVMQGAKPGTPSEAEEAPAAAPAFMEKASPDLPSISPGLGARPPISHEQEFVPAGESPLLRDWNAEIARQAKQAAEAAAEQAASQTHRRIEEFERVQASAREEYSTELAARQEEILDGLKSAFQHEFGRIHELLRELDQKTQALHAEKEAALEAESRLAQAQVRAEALGAAGMAETVAAGWRQRLESEMALAQSQWNELLQSSLDGGIQRLVEQLSARSQDILRGVEQKMSERFAELREPLGQIAAEGRATLATVKAALEQEVVRARSSLAEIEHSSNRMKEYSAQLEAASHDTLNELHRRLESILAAQTDEMGRRVEDLAAALPQRLAPTLDLLGQQFVERTIADVESKLAPRADRVPELLRELAAREVQVEESLRLHRERLRQVSENNQREMSAQASATLVNLRGDLESARKEDLAKWGEELDAAGVRASHTAAEAIGRSSEWFQQEARARLQVLIEQTLTAAGNSFDEKTAEAVRQFGEQLEEQSVSQLGQIRERIDGIADEIAGRSRTQIGQAAEAAAASFGQVLRGISAQEVAQFTESSRNAVKERERDLEEATQRALQNLEASAESSMERFRAQMASQLESAAADGRSALAAEFASAVEGYRAERDAHEKQWTESLEKFSEDAAAKYQERLQTACDSWMVSSVRKLNEHGQNAIESLIRSADQSLRDSCSKVFENLAAMLRDRAANAASVVGFTPSAGLDTPETPAPHNQSAAGGSTA